MQLKFETSLDYFLFFIILIKIVFVISAIGHVILSHSTSAKAEKLATLKQFQLLNALILPKMIQC